MANRASLWSRDELVQVLALYCQIPFGQMHARNPLVTRLAERIGRTPSAVALKLANFASLDSSLRARGVVGMGNVSRLDRNIWDEYRGRWGALAMEAVVPEITLDAEKELWGGRETETMRLGKQRLGSAFFRNSVMAAYEGRCAVTGIAELALLRASHIVPWSHRRSTRLDPRNGILLNALHDAAFDRGLVTFDPGMRLVLGRELRDRMPRQVYRDVFERYASRVVQAPEKFQPLAEYIAYHREKVFHN